MLILCHKVMCIIRGSVDDLCRDSMSEISRDPRTKRLLTQRERLAGLENTQQQHLKPSSFLPAFNLLYRTKMLDIANNGIRQNLAVKKQNVYSQLRVTSR